MFLDSFLVVVLLALCSVIVASPTATSPTQNHNQNQQRASETCIDRGGVQGASKITGQEPGSPGLKAGQSASDTYVGLIPTLDLLSFAFANILLHILP